MKILIFFIKTTFAFEKYEDPPDDDIQNPDFGWNGLRRSNPKVSFIVLTEY